MPKKPKEPPPTQVTWFPPENLTRDQKKRRARVESIVRQGFPGAALLSPTRIKFARIEPLSDAEANKIVFPSWITNRNSMLPAFAREALKKLEEAESEIKDASRRYLARMGFKPGAAGWSCGCVFGIYSNSIPTPCPRHLLCLDWEAWELHQSKPPR